MTRTEYTNQWDRDFKSLTNESIPDYDDFKICERMLEDYLDIFRGFNSRQGDDLPMPYPHPFFNSNGNPLLSENPTIRYILIGEARPPLRPSIFNNCDLIQGDINNSYFYDIRHVNATPWLDAPRLNWGCPPYKPCPTNKIQTLLSLASNGVLLLDLFPYSISYGNIRAKLNSRGVTKTFWDSQSTSFCLLSRIAVIQNLLHKDWDLSLVAPCIISSFIINPINGFLPLVLSPSGIHPSQFRALTPEQTRCKLGKDWKKVAMSSAGAPSRHLINLSF
jgi:hypothetical protein